LLGVHFDVTSGESFYNNKMDAVIDELKGWKLVKKDDGAMIVDLKKEGLGVALIQKRDGTSLYTTRDLATAIERRKNINFIKCFMKSDRNKNYIFSSVFKILRKSETNGRRIVFIFRTVFIWTKTGKSLQTRRGKTSFYDRYPERSY